MRYVSERRSSLQDNTTDTTVRGTMSERPQPTSNLRKVLAIHTKASAIVIVDNGLGTIPVQMLSGTVCPRVGDMILVVEVPGGVVGVASSGATVLPYGFVFELGTPNVALTLGYWGSVPFSIPSTFTGCDIYADNPGDVVVDIQKTNYALYPVSGSICAGHKPTLVNADKAHVDISDWGTELAVGDQLRFIVESASNVSVITLGFRMQRTAG